MAEMCTEDWTGNLARGRTRQTNEGYKRKRLKTEHSQKNSLRGSWYKW